MCWKIKAGKSRSNQKKISCYGGLVKGSDIRTVDAFLLGDD